MGVGSSAGVVVGRRHTRACVRVCAASVCVCVCVCRRVHDDDDDARHIIINQSINPSIMKTPTAGAAPVRGYWDASEEGALRRAVQKHGIGAWEKMRNDPEFTALRCVDDDDATMRCDDDDGTMTTMREFSRRICQLTMMMNRRARVARWCA